MYTMMWNINRHKIYLKIFYHVNLKNDQITLAFIDLLNIICQFPINQVTGSGRWHGLIFISPLPPYLLYCATAQATVVNFSWGEVTQHILYKFKSKIIYLCLLRFVTIRLDFFIRRWLLTGLYRSQQYKWSEFSTQKLY